LYDGLSNFLDVLNFNLVEAHSMVFPHLSRVLVSKLLDSFSDKRFPLTIMRTSRYHNKFVVYMSLLGIYICKLLSTHKLFR
jgi:hypothetical protein